MICVKKNAIPDKDIGFLVHSMVLTRKAVVWVEFGVNIGSEFGGRHPAIIMKNLDNSLIVIPISSQEPSSNKFSVPIDTISGFSTLKRWVNVTRIHEIDIARIDFSQHIGYVNSKVMQDISEKIHTLGII